MTIKAYNFDWCIEEEDVEELIPIDKEQSPEAFNNAMERECARILSTLPSELVIETDDAEKISDLISDATGYLLYSFDYDVIK